MKSLFPLTFSLTLVGLQLGCSTINQDQYIEDELASSQGAIAYPFVEESKVLGRDGKDDKFVIRSTVGQTEYQIEIPGAARDYDIEVPLADLNRYGASGAAAGRGPVDTGSLRPQVTDNEFVSHMPKIPAPADRTLLEGALGVGHADGPTQSPSYTMKIAAINSLFVERRYEVALIEINDLLTYYPSSAHLYKMKGTVLVKMRNFKMAELAWTRGLELAPQDQALRAALDSLRVRLNQESTTASRP